MKLRWLQLQPEPNSSLTKPVLQYLTRSGDGKLIWAMVPLEVVKIWETINDENSNKQSDSSKTDVGEG